MIMYRHFAPRRFKCLECGHSPLEIWAFVYDIIDRNGWKHERSTPVLVCGPFGCGAWFDPMEYDLSEEDLVDYVIEDEIIDKPIELCLLAT